MKKMITLFIAVFLFWIATPFISRSITTNDLMKMGQLGDLFGSINSLFSGLAFAALIYTIVLQRRDLLNQQEELKLQRDELKLQRNEMAKSNMELSRQVEFQEKQYLATLCQLKMAVPQAKIESLVIRGIGKGSERLNHADGVLEQAKEIENLVEGLESNTSINK